jgi:hypothetical protein
MHCGCTQASLSVTAFKRWSLGSLACE